MEERRVPATRYHLYKLTRRIDRLEHSCVFSYPWNGTGVRAMSKEIGAWQRQRAKIAELRKEKALVEAGLLKIQTSGSEMLYSLTKDGLIQVLKDRIRLEPMELPNGERCYVIFDVPEDVKKTRNAFRRFLKKAGFKQIQLSVWATHKDVVDDLQQLITALKIGKWAKVIVGESLEAKTATIDQ